MVLDGSWCFLVVLVGYFFLNNWCHWNSGGIGLTVSLDRHCYWISGIIELAVSFD